MDVSVLIRICGAEITELGSKLRLDESLHLGLIYSPLSTCRYCLTVNLRAVARTSPRLRGIVKQITAFDYNFFCHNINITMNRI